MMGILIGGMMVALATVILVLLRAATGIIPGTWERAWLCGRADRCSIRAKEPD